MKTEPVVEGFVVVILVAIGAGFLLGLSEGQVAAAVAGTATVVGLVVRSKVTPVE